MRRGLVGVSIAVAGLLAQPEIALAAVERPETWLGVPSWVWAWANLFVLWGILYKFLAPLIRKGLRDRKQAISQALSEAQQQRQDAEQMAARLEQQVADLEAQMDDLVANSVREGEAERERILEQAEAESVRVLEQATAEIRNRTNQARAELRAYAAELAGELAAERVAEQLSNEDRRRIFEENLHRLGDQIS